MVHHKGGRGTHFLRSLPTVRNTNRGVCFFSDWALMNEGNEVKGSEIGMLWHLYVRASLTGNKGILAYNCLKTNKQGALSLSSENHGATPR